MPAYFSMIMEFSRAELDFDNMKELNAYIKYAGLVFKGGVGHAKDDTVEDIIDWNQHKLEEDFELGYDEDSSNDYKQMCFSFGGFSEIRGYIMNEDPIRGEYTFNLLIPEDEVAEDSKTYKKEAVDKLKELASLLWILPKTRTIQTKLELREGIVPEMDIRDGAEPSACPFAIVSEKQFGRMDTADYTAEHINAGGVILIPNWVKLV
ncbi:MAG: hypothetical protein J6U00_06290 [Ruminococcus sp.]|uniref:hypothetical protein n=1 Tax=Ruminococcus sp. TaxID=41978 RepID=UPI001B137EEE|nr:hypothetical protein [Ruminococcus sp.]MBO7473598.1 hypothetical protein [Ruminococcus sp.]